MIFDANRLGRRGVLALSAAAVLSFAAPGGAQAEYPEKAIEFVVPFGAGGGFDRLARALAEPLEKELGVPVVVKNSPGSGGRKGSIDLIRSKPDGYTIGMPHFVPFVTDQALFGKEPGLDITKFEVIAMVAEAKHFIYVPASSSIKSLEDLKAAGEVKFTNTGLGSNAWTHATAVANIEGFKADFVSGYKSLTEAALGAVRGDADAGVGGMHQLSGMMEDLRPIVYFHQERSPNFPDAPTVVELGHPELADLSTPYIVAAPPGTPEDVQAKLREAVSKVAASEAYKSWIESAGYVWANKGPEDTMKAVDGARAVYVGIAPLIKQE